MKLIIEDSVNCLELLEVKLSAALKMFGQVKGDDVTQMARELVESSIQQISNSISFKSLVSLHKYKAKYKGTLSFSDEGLDESKIDFLDLCRFYLKEFSFDDPYTLYLPFASSVNRRDRVEAIEYFDDDVNNGPSLDDLLISETLPISIHDMTIMSDSFEPFKNNHDLFGTVKYLDHDSFRTLEIILSKPSYTKALISYFLSKFTELVTDKEPEFDHAHEPEDDLTDDFNEIFKSYELSCYAYNAIEDVIKAAKHQNKEELPNKVKPNSEYWSLYLSSMETLYKKISDFVHNNENLLKSFLGVTDSNKLYSSIYEFLIANNMNPLGIPTIRELGEKSGGFALVKKISNVGGLRKIRDGYIQWAANYISVNNTYSALAIPTDISNKNKNVDSSRSDLEDLKKETLWRLSREKFLKANQNIDSAKKLAAEQFLSKKRQDFLDKVRRDSVEDIIKDREKYKDKKSYLDMYKDFVNKKSMIDKKNQSSSKRIDKETK
ncbi:hypothetical protein DNJ72_04015 [Prochlorococcus marinus XMU1403]|nr:hypothetical protein DNJ72_04015 [Prochlorococcus marinus XMU1403]